jgi:8-oxo-dGTP diphosphatase
MTGQYRPFVDVFAVLLRGDNQVLLGRRSNTGWSDGLWNLPSGKLDEGESLTAAVIREAREEVGVTFDPAAVQLVHVLHWRNTPWQARIGFFYLVRRWTGDPYNAEPHKCSQLGWFPIEQPPPDTDPYNLTGLRACAAGQPYATIGWSHG